MTVGQFAKTHGVSSTTVIYWMKRGLIKFQSATVDGKTAYWITQKHRPVTKNCKPE